jgi:type I restriction enzyme S subunit
MTGSSEEPTGSPTKKLGDVVKNFDSKRIPLSSRERALRQGKFPYYGAAGCIDGVDNYIFEGLYLLVGEDGSVVRDDGTPFLQMVSGKFWVNNHAHVLKGEDDIETRYLYYALKTLNISSRVTGAVQPKLNQGNLNSLVIVYPDRSDRERIVTILGALDDKIEMNRRINETLEHMARALFKSWFIDFDPVHAKAGRRQPAGMDKATADLFPDSFVDSELGKIPKGWTAGSVYEISEVKYGAPFASSLFNSTGTGKPLVRIRDLADESPAVFTTEVHPKGYLLQPGDIAVGMDGEFRAYLWAGIESWLNQRICVFAPKEGFSAAFVRNSIMGPLSEVESTETATTVIHLGKNDIDRFKVVIPNTEITKAFRHLCQPWYDQVVANKQQSRTLSALRDSLLPKLLSGEYPIKAHQ